MKQFMKKTYTAEIAEMCKEQLKEDIIGTVENTPCLLTVV